MEPRRHRIDVDGVGLAVLELGPADAPPLVMLHGMRDVPESLLPVAEPLARNHRLLLPALRGHGDSDRPGGYAMDQFLYDLYRTVEALEPRPFTLFGHSLGGQIGARFAALYPHRVAALVLVEGLGPPARLEEDDAALRIRHHAERLLATLTPPPDRPLPDLEFAAGRLSHNNPRLPPGRARELAALATRRESDGHLRWAFDARVASVFLGVQRQDTEHYWRAVRCPTLVVSGDEAAEYWRAQMALPGDGEFAPGELEARVRCFADAEHVAIAGAGHMVHYDRPADLTAAVEDFLGRRT